MHRSFDGRPYRLGSCYTKNLVYTKYSIQPALLGSDHGVGIDCLVNWWWMARTDRNFSCKLFPVKVLCILHLVSSHKFIKDPTFPTLRSDFSDLLSADRPNILLNSIHQKTENSTSQAVALLHLKIDSSTNQVVYLNVDAAGSTGLTNLPS